MALPLYWAPLPRCKLCQDMPPLNDLIACLFTDPFLYSRAQSSFNSRPGTSYYQPAGPLISHNGSSSKSVTPEPHPPPYPYQYGYDYPSYYRAYRRPWPSTSQMMDYLDPPPYPPPPPHPNYYPYPPPPPPPCYTNPVRGLPFMDQGFQMNPCPCPMQSSCPKNVHTGPLTGTGKRSENETQTNEAEPLLPVALALPPPPNGGSPGPPSPARGSAGMPPPSSPALSTARNNSWSPPAQDLLKTVTPPPSQTIVESTSPPPTVPIVTPSDIGKRKGTKRTSTETQEVPKKKKKVNAVSGQKLQNRKKSRKTVVVKSEPDNIELNGDYKKANKELVLRKNPFLRWSNGWSWLGESFIDNVYITTEEMALRKCYPAMRHREGDIIKTRDCILMRSGSRKNLPFVAKIAKMWENPDDGEMMVSVLWYYRPEHTEQGRQPNQPSDEIFASKHRDANSVACIEDKCYVLTFNEYCRYRRSLLIGGKKPYTVAPPLPEGYPRENKLPSGQVSSDLVFFCRQVYDFRQKKLLKKPPSQPQTRS